MSSINVVRYNTTNTSANLALTWTESVPSQESGAPKDCKITIVWNGPRESVAKLGLPAETKNFRAENVSITQPHSEAAYNLIRSVAVVAKGAQILKGNPKKHPRSVSFSSVKLLDGDIVPSHRDKDLVANSDEAIATADKNCGRDPIVGEPDTMEVEEESIMDEPISTPTTENEDLMEL